MYHLIFILPDSEGQNPDAFFIKTCPTYDIAKKEKDKYDLLIRDLILKHNSKYDTIHLWDRPYIKIQFQVYDYDNIKQDLTYLWSLNP